jgi:hypothetical protein
MRSLAYKPLPMTTCFICQNKTSICECGLCQASLCKNCRSQLSHKDFALIETKPEHLNHKAYCPTCFDEKIAPELFEYQEFEAKAYETYMLTKNYNGSVRVFSRHIKTVAVEECVDRRQMILMLAYQAARLGFNAIISTDIKSKKVFESKSYSSHVWSGSALPAQVDGERLELASLKGA